MLACWLDALSFLRSTKTHWPQVIGRPSILVCPCVQAGDTAANDNFSLKETMCFAGSTWAVPGRTRLCSQLCNRIRSAGQHTACPGVRLSICTCWILCGSSRSLAYKVKSNGRRSTITGSDTSPLSLVYSRAYNHSFSPGFHCVHKIISALLSATISRRGDPSWLVCSTVPMPAYLYGPSGVRSVVSNVGINIFTFPRHPGRRTFHARPVYCVTRNSEVTTPSNYARPDTGYIAPMTVYSQYND